MALATSVSYHKILEDRKRFEFYRDKPVDLACDPSLIKSLSPLSSRLQHFVCTLKISGKTFRENRNSLGCLFTKRIRF